MQKKGPLTGIRVVELATALAAPGAARIMADQGADVIKVETPGIGDVLRFIGPNRNGVTAIHQNVNRGKRSIAIDLKSVRGNELVKKLAAGADVFMHNFRPGVAERLGIGYDDMCEVNEKLIYVSVTGFGHEGPYAKKPAWDNVVQAFSGVAQSQADPETGEPTQFYQIFVDKLTAVTASQAITAALFARDRGAGGQHIQLAMADSVVAFLWPDVGAEATFQEKEGMALGTPLTRAAKPLRFANGWAQVAPVNDKEFFGLYRAFGVDVGDDSRLATIESRMQNLELVEALMEKVSAIALDMEVETAIARLEAEDVPCSRVMALAELPQHPQMVANGTFVNTKHPEAGNLCEPRDPARFSKTPSMVGTAAPALGQHTDEILQEIGLASEVALLRADKTVS
ncbi:MAG: CoA transferase [bacterium]|nr:CoA transferase [bacterium]